mmetsp:Transcript_1833/g.2092  ORF Transcript_1833/g.2092 Transcript_1833/m.2092 type:complete len:240 (-) Transcript_1833:501-1220(-)
MNGNNNESINKVTAKSYGNLDTVETEKECWMIRIPPKLASAWEDCPPGSILGELVFRKGGGKGPNLKKIKPSLEVHVDPNIINNGSGGDCGPTIQHQQQQLPLHYSLQAMTKKLPTLHPFSRKADGSVKIHGKVSRTANLQVIQDTTYRAMCKSRILATTVHSQRFVKPVDSNQVHSKPCSLDFCFEYHLVSFCFKFIIIILFSINFSGRSTIQEQWRKHKQKQTHEHRFKLNCQTGFW